MKTWIPACFALILITSCAQKKGDTVVGTWKLVQNQIDIGNGKPQFVAVNATQTITFYPDGSLSNTSAMCSGVVERATAYSGTYKTSKKQILPDDCAKQTIPIYYDVRRDTLVIRYACVETCTSLYVKVP